MFAAEVYIRGVPTIVTIDDYLAVDSKGKLYFSQKGDDGSIWVPLIEKIWAKTNGYY